PPQATTPCRTPAPTPPPTSSPDRSRITRASALRATTTSPSRHERPHALHHLVHAEPRGVDRVRRERVGGRALGEQLPDARQAIAPGAPVGQERPGPGIAHAAQD